MIFLIGFDLVGPVGDQLAGHRRQLIIKELKLGLQFFEQRRIRLCLLHQLNGSLQLITLGRNGCLLIHQFIVIAVVGRDLGEIANPRRRNHRLRNGCGLTALKRTEYRPSFLFDLLQQEGKQPIHPFVVELAGHGGNNGKLCIGGRKQLMIAFVLFADIGECIEGAGLIRFIQTDQIGVIEHIDLLELSGRSVFGGHYI